MAAAHAIRPARADADLRTAIDAVTRCGSVAGSGDAARVKPARPAGRVSSLASGKVLWRGESTRPSFVEVQNAERITELAVALEDRLHGTRFPLEPAAHDEIKRRVHELTDELKAAAMSPEHTLVVVKRLASVAGISASWAGGSEPTSPTGREHLLADMVGWCIERYYAPPPRAD